MTTPTLTQQPCQCGARVASECPGEWEPGCDLGANEAHVRVAPKADEDALNAALAATVEKAAPAIEDPVTVPRGLLGAACYAMGHPDRDNTKTLAELRRYTVGDLSAQQAAQPVAQWDEASAVALAHRAGFAGTCWTMGPYELVHMLNLTAAQPVAEVGDLIIQLRERVMAGGARNRDPLYTAAPAPVGLTGWTFTRGDDGRIVVGSPINGPGVTATWPARSGGSLSERILYALADALLEGGIKAGKDVAHG